jgi:hypothetical protein
MPCKFAIADLSVPLANHKHVSLTKLPSPSIHGRDMAIRGEPAQCRYHQRANSYQERPPLWSYVGRSFPPRFILLWLRHAHASIAARPVTHRRLCCWIGGLACGVSGGSS